MDEEKFRRCYKEDCKHPVKHLDEQGLSWCGHHWRRREKILDTSTKACIICGKEKLSKDFKSPKINEPATVSKICKDCYTWLDVKLRTHSKRADTPLTMTTWLEALEQSEGNCDYCKTFVGIGNLTIEHMTPISKGGSNDKSNIAAICRSCNTSKGGRDIETWQRSTEATQLLIGFQEHLGLSSFETINLAIKQLAIAMNGADYRKEM